MDITAVDNHSGCLNFLKQEAIKLGFDNIETIKADAMRFLQNTEGKFDIIFCDAPYTTWTQYEEMVRVILDRGLLKEDGWCIVEHHSVVKLDHVPEIFDRRAYGQNIMSFFKLPDLVS